MIDNTVAKSPSFNFCSETISIDVFRLAPNKVTNKRNTFLG